MDRLVKDQLTGEKALASKLYCVESESSGKKVKKYYTSKEAYEKWSENNLYRMKCIDAMFEVMGYSKGMMIPTLFYKKLKDFESVGYEALYNTMVSQNKYVQYALQTKTFNTEVSKVMYIMAIYSNHVMDEYKMIVKKNREKKKESVEYSQMSISDFEINNRKKVNKDISKYLESV